MVGSHSGSECGLGTSSLSRARACAARSEVTNVSQYVRSYVLFGVIFFGPRLCCAHILMAFNYSIYVQFAVLSGTM